LKTAFPDVLPVERPKVKDQLISDPNWLAGFATGEGCLSVNLKKTLSHRLGVQSQLEFSIGQHTRDEQLIKRFMAYFLCGNVRQIKNVVIFGVTRSIDIQEKIIPFFKKYPILGSKSEDFEDFCKVAEIIKNGLHKTEEGLENIRKIKAR